MADDYYKTLGVKRDASQADIQKAYRDLARKYHPDLNPDDKTAKKKFQEVQTAFDVLNDPGKREMYDRYGANFEQMGQGAGPQRRGPARGQPGMGPEDFDFSQFFGERFGAEDLENVVARRNILTGEQREVKTLAEDDYYVDNAPNWARIAAPMPEPEPEPVDEPMPEPEPAKKKAKK